jgi:hypothetical protein
MLVRMRRGTGGRRGAGHAGRGFVRAGWVCAFSLLAGGCSYRGLRAANLDQELEMRVAQCAWEPPVEPLPPVSAVLDTAALTRGMKDLLQGAQLERSEAVLTLWFQEDGMNTRRQLLSHALPPAVADSVQKLVFASLRSAPPRQLPWGARLRVEMQPEAQYTLQPREHCPPRPRSRVLESEIAGYLGTGMRYRDKQRERVVLMEVTVHPLGYVLDARVVRGAPSGGSMEVSLRDHLRQFSFYPASIDGVPVQGQLLVPVRVRG